MTEFASPCNSMNDARQQHIRPSGGTGGFLHFNLLLTEATNVQSLKLSMSIPSTTHVNSYQFWKGSTPRRTHQNIQLWGISAIAFKDFGVVYICSTSNVILAIRNLRLCIFNPLLTEAANVQSLNLSIGTSSYPYIGKL